MKLLFWNTYRNKKINPYIEGIVADYDVDMLVLSEYLADKNELSIALAEGGQQLVESNTIGCDRINIWGNYIDIEAVVLCQDLVQVKIGNCQGSCQQKLKFFLHSGCPILLCT